MPNIGIATAQKIAPYGTWKSPLTPEVILTDAVGLGSPCFDQGNVYFTELRPKQGARVVIVRRTPDENLEEMLPEPFSARSRVHEYGGRCYEVKNGIIYFTNAADQRIYVILPGGLPEPLTSESERRYADFILDERRQCLIAVCEDHSEKDQEPKNSLVEISVAGGQPKTIVCGADFYSTPRLSPDGTKLAWLSWSHPQMPWDGTQLWVGCLPPEGADWSIVQDWLVRQRIAGGPRESIVQPEWSPDGTLHYVSDRSGFYNIYRSNLTQSTEIMPIGTKRSDGWSIFRPDAVSLAPMSMECGDAQWVFGMSTYAFTSAGRIVFAYKDLDRWHLGLIDPDKKDKEGKNESWTPLPCDLTEISTIRTDGNRVIMCAGSPSKATALVEFVLAGDDLVHAGEFRELKRSTSYTVEPRYLSLPQLIKFRTEDGQIAYARYYPPKNDDFRAPESQLPGLVVESHGGPTSRTRTTLDLETLFWTSRGFGLLDVDYGGSSGYGRDYRRRLWKNWGVVDVQDCENAALELVWRGLVDPARLAIRGGSAGGYTTLCALTSERRVFSAGACHYGVGDLMLLIKGTHKFESRYLDSLVGPLPECADIYQERSPINHIECLSCPIIFFHGDEDEVVPPDQAEKMVAAMKAKEIPVAFVRYPDEGHGFRRAPNIIKTMLNELSFYGQVFGFEPADPLEPVCIHGLKGQLSRTGLNS